MKQSSCLTLVALTAAIALSTASSASAQVASCRFKQSFNTNGIESPQSPILGGWNGDFGFKPLAAAGVGIAAISGLFATRTLASYKAKMAANLAQETPIVHPELNLETSLYSDLPATASEKEVVLTK
ncbi:hypothetical protein H6G20_13320 [Desertifilum sp. FACHB-1129]|uniref:Uncharacterized protein n=2 Tax=Desertifilum tharense IPPAS B-1220 TaxID=1781255 RepID=A0A1E5QI93_9CYAN|nr:MULTISPECIES: hypothetical protein [Desertifilum]MDA0210051.1 hypothetical protein [Cyanobacteria bacterium FC1]MBD2312644.1 hypothetical protein [Desertifilum sp. FACHB-1129]MBD2320456.1 hypothetical protein [Desertifilum sp. FACHB-866]MBD2330584.1 hypothetical protein [Desertifilum sp. FACHB-868]OEJ74392.1 hypothetical protein BH720_14265 [Desertifilum tharense IPPAS B-1220]